MKSKIKSREELKQILEQETSKGHKVVFTNGCFDLIHAGHVRYLEAAAGLGDILVLGMNSDASVRRIKGESRPIMSQNDRAEVLAGLAAVSYVVIFEEDDPASLIEQLEPDILVKGADWAEDRIIGADSVKARGGRVERISLLEGRSTSEIIRAIKNLDDA